MSEVSEKWQFDSITNVCQRTRNKTLNPLEYPTEQFEYYSIPAFQESGRPVIEVGGRILSQKMLVENGTVLFGKLNPRVLKVWLVNSDLPLRKIATTEFLPILPNSRALADYLYYLCQSSLVAGEAQRLVSGSTPSRERVDPTAFYQLQIPLPPLLEQRAIAATLRAVQEARDARRHELVAERERKAALMEDLFTGGVRGEARKETEIGPLPQGWEVKKLRAFCDIVRGASPRPKGDERYYGGTVPRLLIADVTRDGKWVTPRLDFLTEEGAKLSRPMVAGSMAISLSGTVGLPCFLEVDACIHDGFVGLRNLKDIYPDFLYYQLLFRRESLVMLAPHGSIFKNLTTDVLKDFPVFKPSIDEQKDIAAAITACDSKIAALEAEAALHDDLFRALLDELLSGRVSTRPLIEDKQEN